MAVYPLHIPLAACLVAGSLGLGLAPGLALAQQDSAIRDLSMLDLEDLGSIKITSVSRRPESVAQASAAVSVLSRDDIRRSGARNLAEALRNVPGLQVAQVTGRDWSVTARGFAEPSPNKLLVLIDGRAVYSPLFAGVFWDVQDVMLEDVDRIEVILGPGATLWGSNAVNGVINITTRSAAVTLDGLAAARVGTNDHLKFTGRYGVSLGTAGGLRAYGQYVRRGPSRLEDGTEGEDNWHQGQGGFRLDLGATAPNRLTVQGDIYTGFGRALARRALLSPPFSEMVEDDITVNGGNLLARYTRRIGGASELQVQAYYDRSHRRVIASFGTVEVDIYDIEAQYRLPLRRHDIIWGAGYRINSDTISGTFPITLIPQARTTHLFTAFAQDEIALVRNHWYLTVGAKLERNEFSGAEFQPNVRMRWSPDPRHTAWAAVSRAVRIPSRLDTDVDFITGVIPGSPLTLIKVLGNENFDSEELVAYEFGYRSRMTRTLGFDLALYYNDYDRLRSIRPLTPFQDSGFNIIPVTLANDLRGHSHGGTLGLNWQPHHRVLLRGSYTRLETDVELVEDAPLGSVPNVNPGFNPRHQGKLRTSLTFPRGIQFDVALRYIGQLPDPLIEDYFEADSRLAWSVWPTLTLALIGRNLLADQHPELSSAPLREIQRAAEFHVEWLF